MNNNQSLSIEMYVRIHSAKSEIYKEFIKRCITGVRSEEKTLLLSNILHEVPISDQAFNWLAENETKPDCYIPTLLIDKKMELDTFIENVTTQCKKERYKDINLYQLDNILEKLYPSIKMGFKIYLYELLIDSKFYPYMYRQESEVFPLQNISNNYKTISYCIDNAIMKAAHYARWGTFQELWSTQKVKRLHWRFQPSTNSQHAKLLKWVESNVRRGEEDVDAVLGWTCGPDSAPWPSTNLCDYQNTLRTLYEIME